MRGLLATKGAFRMASAIACVLALVTLIPLIAGHPKAQGQVQPREGHCTLATGISCPDCNATFPPQFGCTAAPPYTWSLGTCMGFAATCSEWTNYNCGVEILCGYSNPTGNNCLQSSTLCR